MPGCTDLDVDNSPLGPLSQNASQKQNLNQKDLIEAIQKEDIATVENCVKYAPDLLLARTIRMQTMLQIGLESGNAEIVAAILQGLKSLGEDKLSENLFASDIDHWNALHYAANYADEKTVASVIQMLGVMAHTQALKITHEDGSLPIMLVAFNPHKEKKAIRKLLQDITIEKTNIDTHAPIHFTDVLKNDTTIDIHNKKLLMNLHYGCLAASHVRRFINNIPTHTNSNSLSKKDYLAAWKEIDDLRDESSTRLMMLHFTPDVDCYLQQKLAIVEEVCKIRKSANCYEFSALIMETLVKMGVSENFEVFTIENGDHTFVILGREPNSDVSDYTKWGDAAVVVDAWAGDVYPVSEIPKKMKNYATFPSNRHRHAGLIMPYDKDYYKLTKQHGFSTSFFKQTRKPDYADFTCQELNEKNQNENFITRSCP